jgi:hemerythrin-like domain-containing protein
MASSPSPIKRSEQLSPLSREHHTGLQFCWKLRQGIAIGADIPTMFRFVRWSWENHFSPHFEQEERLLLPSLAESSHGEQLRREHHGIRHHILSLREDSPAESFSQLADLIDNHIRFEERQLFGLIENMLSTEELDRIAEQLNADPACTTSWEPEFWIKSKQ